MFQGIPMSTETRTPDRRSPATRRWQIHAGRYGIPFLFTPALTGLIKLRPGSGTDVNGERAVVAPGATHPSVSALQMAAVAGASEAFDHLAPEAAGQLNSRSTIQHPNGDL
jgi:hypothetical protein